MFTWLNKQGVKSSEGFSVQVVDRSTIVYREGDKALSLKVEEGWVGDKPAVITKRESFSQWNRSEPIPPELQTKMINNFRSAMEFQGVAVIVQ